MPLRQVDVLAPQLVAVDGLARGLLEDRGGHVLGEPGVAVDVVALDLVAGVCDAPEEAGREAAVSHGNSKRDGGRTRKVACRYLA